MGRLDEQTAIVTGSSRGLGKAMAEAFAEEGANVVTNSRSLDRAQSATDDLQDLGADSVAVEGDVGNREDVFAIVDAAVDRFGSVDVMVNNAGFFQGPAPTVEMNPDDWQQFLDVMLSGVLWGCQAAGRRMIEQDSGGQIINTSSIYAHFGVPTSAAYCATKAGVESLTRTLGVELAEHDIQVNAIAPGFFDNVLAGPYENEEWMDPDKLPWPRADRSDEEVIRRVPMGRYGTMEELKNCALFLAEGTNFMTGQVLVPDGGWTAFGWGSKGP